MRAAVLTLVAVGLVLTARGQEGQAKKKSRLEGTWKVVSAMDNGKELTKAEAEEHTVTFEGENLTIKKGGEVMFKGTLKRDRKKTPREIDVTITEGPENAKGKVSKGIYEVKDDTLKLCASRPGAGERPTEFSAPDGSRRVFLTLQREKK